MSVSLASPLRARLASTFCCGLSAAALLMGGCGTAPQRPSDGVAASPAPATPRGGGYYKDDGPGDNPPANLDSIPDATPRMEPLHRFANRPYTALGESYVPATALAPFRQRGRASWYGRRFHGKPTSSGEPYDMYAMTGAHPTLPIPSYVRVTNVRNGRSVVVRINDRGPFHKGRVIDLSYAAAHRLGYVNGGSAEVEVEAVVPDGVELIANNPPVPPLKGRSAGRPAVAVAALPAAESASDAPASPRLSDAPPGVFLQLGVFSSRSNAEGFRGMVGDSFAEFVDRLEVLADGARFRLHLGPFDDVESAREQAERIARALKLRPFVVQR